MKLRRLRIQDFRNIAAAEIEFGGGRTFLCGGNGQGKTNLLEAVGYVSALRAFRPGDNRTLVREGAPEAALGFQFEHETSGASEVVVRIRPGGKEAEFDGTRIVRLGEFIGRFPTVLFASEDIQLVRAGPAVRRRWLDVHLASLDPAYLDVLQTYHRALDQRNRLLKEERPMPEALLAFERLLAPAACDLVERRRAGVASLTALVAEFFCKLTGGDETCVLAYEPDAEAATGAEWLAMLTAQRPRDIALRSTQRGPHRDDLALKVGGRDAVLFASEGQQRALVLALRFAQLRDERVRRGVGPVVLADDVLGELDPVRRARFWAALDDDLQVLATGTALPADDGRAWDVVQVRAGTFVREPG
jgi:DNA replication and repair protein RecF